MAVTPAVKIRLSRILQSLSYAHRELVKLNDGQVTLEHEFLGTDLEQSSYDTLGDLQNQIIRLLPELETFCVGIGVLVGKIMPSFTESEYNNKGNITKKIVWADNTKTEKVSETVYTYDSNGKKLLNSQTTTYGAVGGMDDIFTTSFKEVTEDNGTKKVIEEIFND